MDDLQPEDDLKPDASDRRTTRTRKSRSVPKLAISRQHLMIGIGVLVLLLLILGIASALKAPTAHEIAQQTNGARDINLSAAAGESGTSVPTSGDASTNNTGQPQSISVPVISPTPTQSTPLTPPPGQQRIELPGNITDALSQQQEPIDELTQNGAVSSLPTAPATVTPPTKLTPPSAVKERVTSRPAQKPTTALPKAPATTTPAKTATPSATKAAAQSASGPVLGAPASHYTLQLSGASRSDTLKAFAKQQKLENYAIYETKRDGQPWFVLVSGSYPSSADARKAISLLPADVQAKKPWVKPIRQVQQDLKK